MAEPDDLLPEQKGELPDRPELATREQLRLHAAGRYGRLRSWATVIVGLLALGLCVLLLNEVR
jgi:hypothetical protein